ncbi:MAG: hypothetical protein RRA15_12440 [bacterium]|nr:hypothetical protein [bacterium]MDT8367272.1 hypothetical protein [bacterium]
MALLKVFQKSGQRFRQRSWQKYWLGYTLAAAVCLVAVPSYGHYMGKVVPIGHTGERSVHLAAQVIASYFEEQMGRETELVETGSPTRCIESVRDREFPMAVVPDTAPGVLPEGVLKLEGKFGPPGLTAIFIIGSDARKKLEFSLVERYLDSLSKGLEPVDWEKALARVEAGEGVRGVALDMLREADLL